MEKTLFLLLAAALAAPALAQEKAPAGKAAAAPAAAKQAKPAAEQGKSSPKASRSQAPSAKAAPAKRAPAAKAARPQAEEPEEAMVMIDSKTEPEETGRFAAAAFDQDADNAPAVPGGLPSSYGQLKGVMNDGGRTLLVLESPDDGAITFVQVTAGKTAVSWKLLDRIPRSLD